MSASIYRHFTHVDELKMAVVQLAFADFARARYAASGDGDDPAVRLLARCRAYTAFALANPGPHRYLFSQHAPIGDTVRPPVDLRVFQALAESISRCQQASLARAGDDPQWLAAQVWAALHGLVLLRLNARLPLARPGPLEQMADQAVARLIGLDTPGGQAPRLTPARQGEPRDEPRHRRRSATRPVPAQGRAGRGKRCSPDRVCAAPLRFRGLRSVLVRPSVRSIAAGR